MTAESSACVVKESGQEEIRFSWWKDGRFAPRPLDLPEDELLALFRKAIKEGIFTEPFLNGLAEVIANRNQSR